MLVRSRNEHKYRETTTGKFQIAGTELTQGINFMSRVLNSFCFLELMVNRVINQYSAWKTYNNFKPGFGRDGSGLAEE